MTEISQTEIIKALKIENECLENELSFAERLVRTSWLILAITVSILVIETTALIFLLNK